MVGLAGEYIGRIFLGMSNNPQYVVRRIDEHGSAPYLVNELGERFYSSGEPARNTEAPEDPDLPVNRKEDVPEEG